MAIIPKVKCSNCDRSYSGMQSKCPYCGARRSRGGRFNVPEDGNPKWRLAVGVLLLIAIICAIIAVANIDTTKDTTAAAPDNTQQATTSPEPSASPSEDSLADVSPSPSDTGEEEETDEEELEEIDSISVQWQFYSGTSEMTINAGDTVELAAVITPSTADVEVEWTSSSKTVCTVDKDGVITGVASGKATITASYGDVTGELIVRVN